MTTSLFSLTGIMVNKGNHPQMAELFRLVKYYNLPRLFHGYRMDGMMSYFKKKKRLLVEPTRTVDLNIV